MYYIFLWSARLLPRLPRWLVRSLPDLIGPLAWLVATPARRQATINARHVLGEDQVSTPAGRRRLRRVVRGMFRTSVSNYLEAFLAPQVTRQEALHRLYIEHSSGEFEG
jgi:lauroyl/myristoyl acyltransferase